jgi:hypothetical protein
VPFDKIVDNYKEVFLQKVKDKTRQVAVVSRVVDPDGYEIICNLGSGPVIDSGSGS